MNTTTRRTRSCLVSTAAFLVAHALCAASVGASPGDLDTSFSGDGKVMTPIGSFWEEAKSVVVQSDGKIVAAGYYESGGSGYNVAVARYNTDGSLDTSFAGDGIQTTSIGSSHDIGNAVAIQSDGKIVVAGETDTPSGADFAVLRYNTDGSLDTSFSGDGIQTTDFTTLDFPGSVAIQSDGKIVVAGSAGTGIGAFDFAVARYNTDGSLDTTFSGDGKLTMAFGTTDDSASSVVIQDDGRIVLAGYARLSSNVFAVARFNSDGSFDTSFSGDGKQTTAIGTDDAAASVRIQGDGKLVVGGTARVAGNYDFAVVRYNTDGSLDTTFSGDGKQTTPIGTGQDNAFTMAIQSDGRILLGGIAYNGSDVDFAVARFETDGSLDTTFSGDGKLTTAVGTSEDWGWSMALQSDGRILLAGKSNDGTPDNYAKWVIVRYRGDECGDGIVGPGESCDDGNTLAGDCCSSSCQLDAALTPCGSTADTICDNPDTCDGAGLCLPNHEVGPTVCRVVAGECDVEELCTAGDCPADDFVAADTPCGDTEETICDKPDTCNGAGSCVPNLEPGTTACRTAVDACDVTEHCLAGNCPADGFAVTTTPCGDPDNSTCDHSDSCDGFGVCLPNYEPATTACPADTNECTDDRCDGGGSCAHPFNTEPCDDGLTCTTQDTCTGGVCVGAVPFECDDADPCTQDACDDTEGCYSVLEPRPVASCIAAPKTALKIKRDLDPSANQLQWKWTGGGAFDQESLGAPETDTAYALCLYDTTTSNPSLAMRIDVAPGESWSSKAPKGFNYQDRDGASDGAQKIQLKTGEAGRTKASLKAGGVNLPEITTPDATVMFTQQPSVIAQLVGTNGICLTSEFDAESTKENTVAQFQAKTKP